MTTQNARLFRHFCGLAICAPFGVDVRVPSLGGNAGQNALKKFGLNYDQLNRLQEDGLIAHDYHNFFPYGHFINYHPFLYDGRQLKMVGNARELNIHGPSLSTVGKELRALVAPETRADYTDALTRYFADNGLQLVEVHTNTPFAPPS
jgi:hypothetical protein